MSSHKCQNAKCGKIFFQRKPENFIKKQQWIGLGFTCEFCGTRIYVEDFRNCPKKAVYTEDYMKTLENNRQPQQEPITSNEALRSFYERRTIQELESKMHLWDNLPPQELELVEDIYFAKCKAAMQQR